MAKTKEISPEESVDGKKAAARRSKVWEIPAASYSAQYHDAEITRKLRRLLRDFQRLIDAKILSHNLFAP
jgi:hypothetical protein